MDLSIVSIKGVSNGTVITVTATPPSVNTNAGGRKQATILDMTNALQELEDKLRTSAIQVSLLVTPRVTLFCALFYWLIY